MRQGRHAASGRSEAGTRTVTALFRPCRKQSRKAASEGATQQRTETNENQQLLVWEKAASSDPHSRELKLTWLYSMTKAAPLHVRRLLLRHAVNCFRLPSAAGSRAAQVCAAVMQDAMSPLNHWHYTASRLQCGAKVCIRPCIQLRWHRSRENVRFQRETSNIPGN